MTDTAQAAMAEADAELETTEVEASTEALNEGGKKALEAERKARRDADQRARDLEARLKEFEDKGKSETELLNERASSSERRAAEAEAKAMKLDVALDKAPEGMPVAQIKKLAARLVGSTLEELEADADDLFSELGPVKAADDEGATPVARRPKERLRPGASSDAEPEADPEKIAERILRRR